MFGHDGGYIMFTMGYCATAIPTVDSMYDVCHRGFLIRKRAPHWEHAFHPLIHLCSISITISIYELRLKLSTPSNRKNTCLIQASGNVVTTERCTICFRIINGTTL